MSAPSIMGSLRARQALASTAKMLQRCCNAVAQDRAKAWRYFQVEKPDEHDRAAEAGKHGR